MERATNTLTKCTMGNCLGCDLKLELCPLNTSDFAKGKIPTGKNSNFIYISPILVRRMKAIGLSQADTSRKLGVSRHTLTRRWRWFNLPTRLDVIALQAQNLSQAEICKILLVSPYALRKYNLWPKRNKGKKRTSKLYKCNNCGRTILGNGFFHHKKMCQKTLDKT